MVIPTHSTSASHHFHYSSPFLLLEFHPFSKNFFNCELPLTWLVIFQFILGLFSSCVEWKYLAAPSGAFLRISSTREVSHAFLLGLGFLCAQSSREQN